MNNIRERVSRAIKEKARPIVSISTAVDSCFYGHGKNLPEIANINRDGVAIHQILTSTAREIERHYAQHR